jgi:hypothetical protein
MVCVARPYRARVLCQVAPVGTAFMAVHAARPALWHDLFHTDGFHPSPIGSYLEALVIYATIFGVLPLAAVSMPDDPAQLWARARVMQPAGTPPLRLPTMEEMRYLRIVAASVCAVPAFDQPAAASDQAKRVAAEKALAKIQTVPVAASPPSFVPQAAASGVDQQDAEDEPLKYGAAESEPKAALGDQAKKDAEAQLRAAMPFWLQKADPAKLAPAIEAAKRAGVAAQTVAMAELKLTGALCKAAKAAEEKERKEAEGAAKAKAEAEAADKAKLMAEARVKAEVDEAKFAAKQANAALTAEAKVAARLKEMQDAENAEIRARRDVETRLRAAMPFPLMTADPARLEPAIEAAKQAGVASPIVAKAEAKLREAEEKAEHVAAPKAVQGTETAVVEGAVETSQVETRSQAQKPASLEAKADSAAVEQLLKFELRLHGAVETFPKQAFQARLCTFLKVDEKAVRKLQLSAGSVVVDAVVVMPDGEALVAGRKQLEDADLDMLSKELDQQARPTPSLTPLALPCPAAVYSPPPPAPYYPPTHPGPT